MLPVEEAIIKKLRSGPCSLDDVVIHLSNFSTGEIFVAIDRMSSDGRLVLRQHGYSTYQLSLGSEFAHSSPTP
jgi:hypothetical protein